MSYLTLAKQAEARMREGAAQGRRPAEPGPVVDAPARQPAPPEPAAGPTPCPTCHEARFWLSIFGVVVCATCHPPACDAVVSVHLC